MNDVYQGRAPVIIERELETMYKMARNALPAIPVVAGSILPYNTASDDENGRMRAVNEWIRGYTAGHPHMAFCDTRAAVARPEDPDRLVSSPDDLHPSSEGYWLMAINSSMTGASGATGADSSSNRRRAPAVAGGDRVSQKGAYVESRGDSPLMPAECRLSSHYGEASYKFFWSGPAAVFVRSLHPPGYYVDIGLFIEPSQIGGGKQIDRKHLSA